MEVRWDKEKKKENMYYFRFLFIKIDKHRNEEKYRRRYIKEEGGERIGG